LSDASGYIPRQMLSGLAGRAVPEEVDQIKADSTFGIITL
jgi:hypothetical protein